jgi:hypothetical protein
MRRRTLEEIRARGAVYTAEAVTRMVTVYAQVGPCAFIPREVPISIPRLRCLEGDPHRWDALDAQIRTRLRALSQEQHA